MIEPRFKPEGKYLSRCHQWVGEPAPPGRLPGWSAASECWWVRLYRQPGTDAEGRYVGGRWIIAGFDRASVVAAAEAKLAGGWVEWPSGAPLPEMKS